MKFGRFHGVALLLLGGLLLLGQAYISIVAHGQNRAASGTESTNSTATSVPPFFGIVGGIVFVAGVALFILSPKKSLSEEVHERRNT